MNRLFIHLCLSTIMKCIYSLLLSFSHLFFAFLLLSSMNRYKRDCKNRGDRRKKDPEGENKGKEGRNKRRGWGIDVFSKVFSNAIESLS